MIIEPLVFTAMDGEKRCRECGEIYPVTHFHRKGDNKDGRSGVCKHCASRIQLEQRERRKEKGLMPETYERRKPRSRETRGNGTPWRIINDPDETWGENTHLNLCDIRELIRMGYLRLGTRFQNVRNSGIIEITLNGIKRV